MHDLETNNIVNMLTPYIRYNVINSNSVLQNSTNSACLVTFAISALRAKYSAQHKGSSLWHLYKYSSQNFYIEPVLALWITSESNAANILQWDVTFECYRLDLFALVWFEFCMDFPYYPLLLCNR